MPRLRALAAGIALTATLAACSSTPESEPVAVAETTTAAATTTKSARPDLTPEQTDETFLQVLDSYSIDYGNDSEGAIHLADTVCDGLNRGLRESDLMVILTDPTSTNLTSKDAQNFLNTSIVAYCPEQGEK